MPDFIDISEPPLRLLHRASLFLDLDGTLLELADSPQTVHVSDAAVAYFSSRSNVSMAASR